MKEKIKKIIYNMNYPLLKNYILMESNPDFMDNPRAVFDELIHRRLNDKYKIIWLVSDKRIFSDIKIKNVKFITRNLSFINKIISRYYNYFSKYIIDSNKCVFKKNKNQFRMFLQHGEPFKNARKYCESIGKVDYIVEMSDFFNEADTDLYNLSKNKFVSLGFPRDDYLYKKVSRDIFDLPKDKKIIMWLPTYRNHKLMHIDVTNKYGIPVVSNENDLKEINNNLKRLNVLLIIKLHPVEDPSYIKSMKLSNLKIIDDEIIIKNHLTIYHLLAITDALLTDYSSVYYDYLHTKKPIGLVIPDLEEYKKSTGFYYDNYKELIKGEYIYSVKDLIKFIKGVANNYDSLYNDRIKKLKLYHKYLDGKSSQRVVDFIIEKNKKGDD